MANKWTDEQQQAIDLRNCSILVSAAAGSGKTAVLVERILQRIMDENNPVNIDSMVIVTFTNAAAGEMRERIRMVIEKEASKYPENAHLQKQKTLIHNANISTIHSFCKMVLRSHFEEIELDPSFRVADASETNLLQKEAVAELLEEYYRKEEEGELNGEFLNFVECYVSNKSDEVIEDFVLKTYEFSMSYPFPEKWLDKCESMYSCKNVEQFEGLDWVQILKEDALNIAKHAYNAAKIAYDISLVESGPYMYADALTGYVDTARALCECKDFASMYDILTNFKAVKLSGKKDAAVDNELRELAKKYKEECNDAFNTLKKKFLYAPCSQICDDLNKMQKNVHILVSLVKDFINIYGEKKREKDVLDFSDLEHFALKILVDDEGSPTQTAKEYADYFDEIMIDEYQDSNYVQELLLNSISKRSEAKENVFMVGDAKQSIYRFRMARPEIFTDKYDNYSTKEGDRRRVDLFKNFRSRREVLYSINYIFEHIMKKQLGGIEYNNEAALHPGAQFQEALSRDYYDTEIMLYEKNALKDEEDIDANEFEARLIAMRIKQMVLSENPFMVTDKKTGELRPCCFKDIAILVRSNTDLAASCMKIFEKMDIPLHLPSKEGYFTTEEIETMLNLLRIIDNPMQDIPLAAVLKSPIGGLSENDLALICIDKNEKCFYNMALDYISQNENELSDKLKIFFEKLEYFRREVNILPLHEFLWLILDETGYGDYICAMQNGQQKKANMEAFVQKALDFEKTSYIGVFQFVQYIEQIRKYNVDEGEVSIINEQDDTVRLMTIHKSKGLEFPVVFVAGLGKQFNYRDEKAAIVMHPELGVGVSFVDARKRQKRTTVLKQLIGNRMHMETVGEELRVLYVALTRAKEKLILTGGVKDIDSALSRAEFYNKNEEIDAMSLVNSGCFMDWILAALNHHPGMAAFYKELGRQKSTYFKQTDWDCNIKLSLYSMTDLIEEKLLEEMSKEQREFDFDEVNKKTEISSELREMLDYEYPYNYSHIIPVKVSVSELKKSKNEENSGIEEEVPYIFEDNIRNNGTLSISDEYTGEKSDLSKDIENIAVDDIIYPEFLKKSEENISGAERGTVYHSIFQRLDFGRLNSRSEIENQIDGLFKSGILQMRYKSCVNSYPFCAFAKSPIGERMKNAERKGLLWREQPFVLGVNSREIYGDDCEDKTVLVQGIIDAFFEEDGELVLVDYKTDYVESGMEDLLINRYRKQIDYYEMALVRLSEKKVKERIIYSVGLNKEISM